MYLKDIVLFKLTELKNGRPRALLDGAHDNQWKEWHSLSTLEKWKLSLLYTNSKLIRWNNKVL